MKNIRKRIKMQNKENEYKMVKNIRKQKRKG